MYVRVPLTSSTDEQRPDSLNISASGVTFPQQTLQQKMRQSPNLATMAAVIVSSSIITLWSSFMV